MTRDHLLFLVGGLLGGFILGYLGHEVVAARQPPRLNTTVGQSQAAEALPGRVAPGTTMPEVDRLRAAVEANPDDADSVLALANANFDIGNWGRAIELYEHYERLRPGDANVLTDLGVCLREAGQVDAAVARFRQAGERDPAHWQSRFNLAIVLASDQHDYAAAEAVIADLRRLQSGNPDVERLAQEIARLRGDG